MAESEGRDEAPPMTSPRSLPHSDTHAHKHARPDRTVCRYSLAATQSLNICILRGGGGEIWGDQELDQGASDPEDIPAEEAEGPPKAVEPVVLPPPRRVSNKIEVQFTHRPINTPAREGPDAERDQYLAKAKKDAELAKQQDSKVF